MFEKKPFIDGKNVLCCGALKAHKGKFRDVASAITDPKTKQRILIGRIAEMSTDDVSEIVFSSKLAWNNGCGEWPQMSSLARINCMQGFISSLKERRDEFVHVLMWEIGKSMEDAQSEFDRTIDFMECTISSYKRMIEKDGTWKKEDGFWSKLKRGPIGIMFHMGPFNYPMKAAFAALFPALLLGNVAIFKVPALGGLVHFLAMESFMKHLPAGVMNFLCGSSKDLTKLLMQSGCVDMFTFIGTAATADAIIKEHPEPHRLRTTLQLESKNLGILLPSADMECALRELTTGCTAFNGQRCTAMKMIFVHKSMSHEFIPKFCERVSQLKWGNPWEPDVKITPLPEEHKILDMSSLIKDATDHGAKLVNEQMGGGSCLFNLMRPAILFPVNSSMRIFHEEQFGPVIPIVEYETFSEVYEYIAHSPFGHQASIFTQDFKASGPLLDLLSNAVCRVNINTQCGRSMGSLPFCGRRSSGKGVLSVTDSLWEFSLPVVLSGKEEWVNENLMRGLEGESKFFQHMMFEGSGTGMASK